MFSLAYAIGAPVMALLTAGLERRRLLAVAMGGFALGNLLAALAPDYAGLSAARPLLALSESTFMPTATGYYRAIAPMNAGTRVHALLGCFTSISRSRMFGEASPLRSD